MINFIISRSSAQPILRSSISPCYVSPNLQKIKNETLSSQPQQTCTKKQKVKNIQTQKIDELDNDHIFYHVATAPRIMLLAAFFYVSVLKPNA